MSEFLRDCWYMAAWSDEIEAAPIARRIAEVPVVLFRTVSGHAAALRDRCPHRFAPLSRGRVEGERILCGYHGLSFDVDGACTGSSFGISVPPGTCVTSFPLVERHNALWLWLGERAAADPANIPDFSYHVDPAYRVVRGRSHIKAQYEVVTDNLMDLTHTRYLHPGFGGEAWVPEVSFTQDGDTVLSHYALASEAPTEFSEAFLPSNGERVAEKDTMRWQAPASMYLHIEMNLVGKPDIRAVQPSSHIVTPEDSETCHYFWASGAEAAAPITDEDHLAAMHWAFDVEDAPMLEAVHAAMEGADFWTLKPAILEYDTAAIRARRIIRKRIRGEQSVAGLADV